MNKDGILEKQVKFGAQVESILLLCDNSDFSEITKCLKANHERFGFYKLVDFNPAKQLHIYLDVIFNKNLINFKNGDCPMETGDTLRKAGDIFVTISILNMAATFQILKTYVRAWTLRPTKFMKAFQGQIIRLLYKVADFVMEC